MASVRPIVAKKIGLISAISMLIGSTIGVGIFFKNINVFPINNYNAIAILIAWIISGIISISTAFSFAEVGSCKQSHSGLGGWYEELVSYKSGKFIKIIQPLFYFMFICFAISIFAAESIFNIFNASSEINFGVIMLVGFVLFVLFLLLNYFSLNASTKFQLVASGLKFIPLLMVIFGGIIYGAMHPELSLFNHSFTTVSSNVENQTTTSSTINFVGIIISIPSILFAFDSFVGVGNLSLDMKNPRRNVPLAIIVGMVIVTLFYILLTVAQILVGDANVYEVFKLILSNNPNALKAVHILLSVFIFISIIGVLNSFCVIVIRSCQSIIEENLVIGKNLICNIADKLFYKKNELYQGTCLSLIYYIFIFIIFLVPSAIVNTDAFIDGISNFPTTIFFSLYATIILATLINRKTKKVNVKKVFGFIPMAIIAIIGCYFVSGFQIFYTFLIQTIINPNEQLKWGLFSDNDFVTKQWVGTLFMLLYLSSLIIFSVVTDKIVGDHKLYKKITFWKEAYD